MAEVRLRPKARSDIDAIWDYTIATWGVQQARHYLNGLHDVCTELADYPELGKCRDELYKGLRVYPSGKHLVFYLIMDKGIDVVRILHGSMDVQRHLR
ncbi:MAG: type II toxin-antitoxin system RelE/ParE family toxin [Gammaproteobacteria bacterium]